MKRRVPEALDLSDLQFLEHGDMTRIALDDQKEGRKTSLSYVSRICAGLHYNPRILKRALDLAKQRKALFN